MRRGAHILLRRSMGATGSLEASSPPLVRSLHSPGAGPLARCNADETTLFVCDVQQRFQDLGLIQEMETVKTTAVFLLRTARILQLDIVVTEQYPEKLGPTVAELLEAAASKDPAGQMHIIIKTRFSMVVDDNPFREFRRGSVIICGIETHVCVLQTALDLLAEGYNVFVVKDGVSSQRPNDRAAALDRMQSAGAIITTAESVVFELLRDSRHPRFKEVSKLLQWRNKQENSFATET